MTSNIINSIAEAGYQKGLTAKTNPSRYFVLAIMAGIFIFIGGIFSTFAAAWFYTSNLALSKLLSGITFSSALILIVLLGGELFTGCNLVMGVSLYQNKVNFRRVLRVWAMTYIGNFVGILFFSLIFVGSAPSHELVASYLAIAVPSKVAYPWYSLILKGALCNFLVCLGVFGSFKVQSDFGKVTVILLVITTFVFSGQEHSIANMVFFSLHALLTPDADLLSMVYNLFFVTIGNVLGGAVLLGLPVWFCGQEKAVTKVL